MMARPREFNTSEALGQALDVFWAKGYEGATMTELLTAMDIGKGSFYNAFGSKVAVYLEALRIYRDKTMDELLAPIAKGCTGLDFIRAFLDRAVGSVADAMFYRGCFFANASMENIGSW